VRFGTGPAGNPERLIQRPNLLGNFKFQGG
jgi:hypothetical protein